VCVRTREKLKVKFSRKSRSKVKKQLGNGNANGNDSYGGRQQQQQWRRLSNVRASAAWQAVERGPAELFFLASENTNQGG